MPDAYIFDYASYKSLDKWHWWELALAAPGCGVVFVAFWETTDA